MRWLGGLAVPFAVVLIAVVAVVVAINVLLGLAGA